MTINGFWMRMWLDYNEMKMAGKRVGSLTVYQRRRIYFLPVVGQLFKPSKG